MISAQQIPFVTAVGTVIVFAELISACSLAAIYEPSECVRIIRLGAPNTHFVILGQAILYRGAGLSVVWPQFVALAVIGGALFALALARFREAIGMMA